VVADDAPGIERRKKLQTITTIGLGIAKSVCQVYGVDVTSGLVSTAN
jgi:hypothetical protein